MSGKFWKTAVMKFAVMKFALGENSLYIPNYLKKYQVWNWTSDQQHLPPSPWCCHHLCNSSSFFCFSTHYRPWHWHQWIHCHSEYVSFLIAPVYLLYLKVEKIGCHSRPYQYWAIFVGHSISNSEFSSWWLTFFNEIPQYLSPALQTNQVQTCTSTCYRYFAVAILVFFFSKYYSP